jgi:hypothetical protein
MWAEGKRDRLRELRLKPMQRHVFLYERGVVLCKRVGKELDKATYQFKHLLKVKLTRHLAFYDDQHLVRFTQSDGYRSFVLSIHLRYKHHQ